MARLRFEVLGPVRGWQGGAELDLGAPRQRAVLAMLLMRSNYVVRPDEIIDAVWGEHPPGTGEAVIHTYVSRLRKVLEAGHPEPAVLRSGGGGYCLTIEPDQLDLLVVEGLVNRARQVRSRGEVGEAARLLREALDGWHGEPLSRTPGPYAEGQRVRLAEQRLVILAERIDADLAVGPPAELVPELVGLVTEHPLRERLAGLLMTALHRTGRRAEALAVFQDLRRRLATELGLDPGAELRELHDRILKAGAGAGAAPVGPPIRPVPSELPADLPDFTGRRAEVADLTGRLTTETGALRVAAVVGGGGVGKTSLAVHVSHRVAGQFPDGRLYAELRGVDPGPADPGEVLVQFLRALGVDGRAVPDGLDDRTRMFRSQLADRRVLVILDNARDADQVRPLLPGSSGCAVLVTSRHRLAELPGARLVSLDLLDLDAATELLTAAVGAGRIGAAPEAAAARRLAAACGGLPLAVRIVAARLMARPEWSVSAMAARLETTRPRLDELRVGSLAVRTTFQFSYDQLPAPAARAFRLLAVPDWSDFSAEAAAALLDRPPAEVEDLIESLVDVNLLGLYAPGRYRYHDLLRLYARELAARLDPPEQCAAALDRLVSHVITVGRSARSARLPGAAQLALSRPVQAAPARFAGEPEATGWFVQEQTNLTRLLGQAAASSPDAAADLLAAYGEYLDDSGHWSELESVARVLQREASRQGAVAAEATATLELAVVAYRRSALDDADRHLEVCLARAEAGGNELVEAAALAVLGGVRTRQARFEEAVAATRQSLDRYRRVGGPPEMITMLAQLGAAYLDLGRFEDALVCCKDALDRGRRVGADRHPFVLYTMGKALHGQGNLDEAAAVLTESLAGSRSAGNPLGEVAALLRLAVVCREAGQPEPASRHATQALQLGRELDDPIHTARALKVLGESLADLGQPGLARQHWSEALARLEQLGSPEAAEVRRLLGAAPDQPGAPAGPAAQVRLS